MNYLGIVKEFAESLWAIKEEIKLVDLMLFGSLANSEGNPRDIDLLFLHQNPILDKFQFEIVDKNISDTKKLYILQSLLRNNVNLEKIIVDTGVERLIQQNLFNTKYMNISFFNNKSYRKKWIGNNRKYHNPLIKKNRIGDETFEECIFRKGKLWDSEKEEYCIPAKSKYNSIK